MNGPHPSGLVYGMKLCYFRQAKWTTVWISRESDLALLVDWRKLPVVGIEIGGSAILVFLFLR